MVTSVYGPEDLRAQMSETVLFIKVKNLELVVCNFTGRLQCRMGGKRKGPTEVYPKFWNLNPVATDMREILRIPAWTRSFEFRIKEFEMIPQRYVLTAAVPGFPTVRRSTMGMNSPLVVPSLRARVTVGR